MKYLNWGYYCQNKKDSLVSWFWFYDLKKKKMEKNKINIIKNKSSSPSNFSKPLTQTKLFFCFGLIEICQEGSGRLSAIMSWASDQSKIFKASILIVFVYMWVKSPGS